MISVIIPYRNAEEWLEGCVKSLKVQEGEMEFLFINDHSKDGSTKEVRKLIKGDDRFSVTHLKNKSGVSAARNAGIDKAQGEWITFLDADDELLPDAWWIFAFMAELDDTINMVQSNHVCRYHNGKEIRCSVNKRGLYVPGNLPKAWCMVWNKLYRRSFIEEYHIRFREGMQYGEDELFNLMCLDKDPRILCTQSRTSTVFHRYSNEGSLSHIKTREDLLEQSRMMEDFLVECDNPKLRGDICRMLSDRWGHRLMEAWS